MRILVPQHIDLDTLIAGLFDVRQAGANVVLSNGCFDLLHVGHVRSLEQAKEFGAILIVAINSDDSVRRLKGPDRPIWNSFQRAAMLATLPCVDFVVEFDESTPEAVIQAIRPDVLVKGGNYAPPEVVGHELLSEWNGRVEIVDLVEGVSTTKIISAIVQGAQCPAID